MPGWLELDSEWQYNSYIGWLVSHIASQCDAVHLHQDRERAENGDRMSEVS